jgi:hypothetical protein
MGAEIVATYASRASYGTTGLLGNPRFVALVYTWTEGVLAPRAPFASPALRPGN